MSFFTCFALELWCVSTQMCFRLCCMKHQDDDDEAQTAWLFCFLFHMALYLSYILSQMIKHNEVITWSVRSTGLCRTCFSALYNSAAIFQAIKAQATEWVAYFVIRGAGNRSAPCLHHIHRCTQHIIANFLDFFPFSSIPPLPAPSNSFFMQISVSNCLFFLQKQVNEQLMEWQVAEEWS